MRQGGIEPPSIAWKATMLTITPLTNGRTTAANKTRRRTTQWLQLQMTLANPEDYCKCLRKRIKYRYIVVLDLN
uniref:Uncharacterized protein n=1 Tax=Wuchereria bancrofti TaxID=6293 RepID=A0AAF5PQM8_WUCBA